MPVQFKNNFLKNYFQEAPLPLALERCLECEILAQQDFVRPVLDIGCGEGLFAHILFAEKIDVGIDLNSREIERAKTYNAYHELICCSGDAIPKENETFNTIFSNSVMEHIKDIEPVLLEASRLLKKKGSLYLTLPTKKFEEFTVFSQILNFLNLNSLAEKFRKFFNRFWRHYHCYDKKQWENIFRKNGFKVVNSFEYGSRKFCTINDFLSPFCLISFITKKITNKWFLFPLLEKMLSNIKYLVFKKMVGLSEINISEGGLIFFQLKKDV